MFKSWKSIYPDSWFACQPDMRGFLPRYSPLEKLQNKKYQIINEIFDEIEQYNLINSKKLYNIIDIKLPLLTFKDEINTQCLATLFRDYSFLASIYFNRESTSDIEDALPKNIKNPLIELSEKLGTSPLLQYAYGYGLNNGMLKFSYLDPGNISSYKICRLFTKNTFLRDLIKGHIAINSYSGELITIQQAILKSVGDNTVCNLLYFLDKHSTVLNKMLNVLDEVREMNKTQCDISTIYTHCYEGIAIQDSIMPCIDNLFQIKYPNSNNHRPKDHQEYINYNLEMSRTLDLVNTIYKNHNATLLLLKNINIVRIFRKNYCNLIKPYANKKAPCLKSRSYPLLVESVEYTIDKMDEIINNLEPKKKLLNQLDYNIYTTLKLEMSDHRKSLNRDKTGLVKSYNEKEKIKIVYGVKLTHNIKV